MMDQELAVMPLEDVAPEEEETLDSVPVPSSLVPHLSETAVLLDIDGTQLDLMPTPREGCGRSFRCAERRARVPCAPA